MAWPYTRGHCSGLPPAEQGSRSNSGGRGDETEPKGALG